jgi:hypothetical protein
LWRISSTVGPLIQKRAYLPGKVNGVLLVVDRIAAPGVKKVCV